MSNNKNGKPIPINWEKKIADEVLAMSELDEKELFSKLGEADFKNRIKNILEATTPAITQLDHLKELLIEFGFYENK